jgi:glycosyltransferase involved in cell wall biosynthesis
MRILLAHNIYPITGGDAFFYRETGRVLQNNGHAVAYFSTKHELDDDPPYGEYFGDSIDYLNGSFFYKVRNFPKVIYSTYNKKMFRKLVNDFNPDLVHCFAIHTKITPSILDICRLEKIPTVISCNDYKHICPNYKLFHHGKICYDCRNQNYLNAIKNHCCKDSYTLSMANAIESFVHHSLLNIYRKNIHTFLFASNFMAEKTLEFWSDNTIRAKILKNPFDSTKFQMTREYDDYCIFFGRLIEEKGVEVLLEAMKGVPKKVKLKIVGDGVDRNKYEVRAKELGLDNIEFVGAKWGEEMDDILRKSRFVVVPSVWHENFPYVIIQSFAFGKPVIGSRRGGIPELIQHGEFGFIFDVANPSELSAQIEQLWNDPQLAISMGTKAKRYADDNFNDFRFYNQLEKIYQEVI